MRIRADPDPGGSEFRRIRILAHSDLQLCIHTYTYPSCCSVRLHPVGAGPGPPAHGRVRGVHAQSPAVQAPPLAQRLLEPQQG